MKKYIVSPEMTEAYSNGLKVNLFCRVLTYLGAKMSVKSIEELPAEVLLKICDYTTRSTNRYKQLYIFGNVCKLFYSVILIHPLSKNIDCIKRICDYSDITCLELFKKIIDSQIMDMLYNKFTIDVTETLKYYGFKSIDIRAYNKLFGAIELLIGDYNDVIRNIIIGCGAHAFSFEYNIPNGRYVIFGYHSENNFINGLYGESRLYGKIIYTYVSQAHELYKHYHRQLENRNINYSS